MTNIEDIAYRLSATVIHLAHRNKDFICTDCLSTMATLMDIIYEIDPDLRDRLRDKACDIMEVTAL